MPGARGASLRVENQQEANLMMEGWVDLRPDNFNLWQERFRVMEASRRNASERGSAALMREAYLWDEIQNGTIVGWIFNYEEEGYRTK